MTLDRFQFQFLYQGFQFQGVQLLFPAFFNIMEEVINQGPWNNEQTVFQR